MSELDAFLGEREAVEMPELRKTSFGRAEPGTRDYLDDFLSAVRVEKGEEDYLPDPLTGERWTGQARLLFRGHGYRSGFIMWALSTHMSEFARQGKRAIVTGPMSVEYLWDEFAEIGKRSEEFDFEPCEECGAASGHAMTCSLREDE